MTEAKFSPALLSEKLDAKEIAFFEHVAAAGGSIQPSVNVRAAIGFCYPAVNEMLGYGPDYDLDYLLYRERQNLLHSRFFDRVNACPDCLRVTVNFREVCAECHNSEISFESVIHHFRCAFVGREEQFRHGVGLLCPKCHQHLRSIGKDFEKPTELHFCSRCESLFSEPKVHGLCLTCSKRFPQEERVVRNVLEFRVTAAIVPALQGQKWDMGYPPSVADELPNVVSEEFLQAMLELEVRRAVRYGRPLSVVSVSAPLLRTGGNTTRTFADIAKLYEFATQLEKIRRNTDIVGRLRSGELVFVLTETAMPGAKAMMVRVRSELGPLTADQLATGATFLDPKSPLSATEMIAMAAQALER